MRSMTVADPTFVYKHVLRFIGSGGEQWTEVYYHANTSIQPEIAKIRALASARAKILPTAHAIQRGRISQVGSNRVTRQVLIPVDGALGAKSPILLALAPVQ